LGDDRDERCPACGERAARIDPRPGTELFQVSCRNCSEYSAAWDPEATLEAALTSLTEEERQLPSKALRVCGEAKTPAHFEGDRLVRARELISAMPVREAINETLGEDD
jgi:hypothetical protein